MLKRFYTFALAVVLFCVQTLPAQAQDYTFATRQAVVWVHCGNRQGSGVIINPDLGYVLTNAHILLNLTTLEPDACEIAFITDDTMQPRVFYNVDWEKYTFDESRNQDFAILRITGPKGAATVTPFPYLKTDEFSQVSDPISILSYPSVAKGVQNITSGSIQGLERGIVKTDAQISPGSSGGAGVDANHNLVGIATRILVKQYSNGTEEVVDYELVDLRAILNWLDTFGTNFHDNFVTHYNYDRYHGPSSFITQSNLTCALLAKAPDNSTVYCLKSDGTRAVFPNNETYHSWFADFSGVLTVSTDNLANYVLSHNVTLKPGTLVKIESDPKVYVVANIKGTLRWIATENRARELFGDGWAGFVKDVPPTFFINYTVGEPIN